ncbi:hypothetical protein ACWEKT_38395 [Nocardia takedensis]
MNLDISCSGCGRIDCVQSVPALCAEGISTSSETGSYTGFGISSQGFVPTVGTMTIDRTHTSALAAAFALAPATKAPGRLTPIGLLLLFPALIGFPVVVSTLWLEDPGHQWSTFIVGLFVIGAWATPGLLTLAAARNRRRINTRIALGRRRARPVWQAGFYCHRCGTAFWPYSPAPSIPARRSLLPHQFRWHVWQVGGYGGF